MPLLQAVVDSMANDGLTLSEALWVHEPAKTTVEETILTLNRLARKDSGLPQLDRERLFTAYCYLQNNWDNFTEAVKKTK